MSPIALFFASGESLYPGAALLLIAVAARFSRRPPVVWLGRLSTWIGLAFVIMACPPLSWGVDALLGVLFLAWLIAGSNPNGKFGRNILRIAITVAFVLSVLALSTEEFLHRRWPLIEGAKSDHLVVVGDSISAGLGSGARSWPEVLHEMTGAEVKNLSKPGATVNEGLAMAELVSPRDCLVLIELGGNDLIAGEPSVNFERSLDVLLSKLVLPQRTVVMFELPLLPHMIRYGEIQRRLAEKYGVWMIPKRFIAKVLSGKDATSDGLHLTDTGARRMATVVNRILSPILKPDSGNAIAPARHP